MEATGKTKKVRQSGRCKTCKRFFRRSYALVIHRSGTREVLLESDSRFLIFIKDYCSITCMTSSDLLLLRTVAYVASVKGIPEFLTVKGDDWDRVTKMTGWKLDLEMASVEDKLEKIILGRVIAMPIQVLSIVEGFKKFDGMDIDYEVVGGVLCVGRPVDIQDIREYPELAAQRLRDMGLISDGK